MVDTLEHAESMDLDGYESDDTLMGDNDKDHPIVLDDDPSLNDDVELEDNWLYAKLEKLKVSSCRLRPGKTVELDDGDFVRITALLEHRITGRILIRGFRLRRVTELDGQLDGLLERKTNEVFLVLRQDVDNTKSLRAQSTETIPLEAIVRVRHLLLTNELYPAFCYSLTEDNPGMSRDWHRANSQLICRWLYLHVDDKSGVLQTLQAEDCDVGYAREDEQLRFDFRGGTVNGGSRLGWSLNERRYDREERERVRYIDPLGFHARSSSRNIVDLTNDGNRAGHTARYTFGDAFCGAGGTSRGAKGAGLRVQWGFDHDPYAIDSYKLNFTGAHCWAIEAHQFLVAVTDDLKVDILHLSPPCQPFSPAHTVPGQHDEANQATFLAVLKMLKRMKPRIVTMEETFGLSGYIEHVNWFKTVIRIFTSLGFSVRWKVFDLRNFGLPQPRMRLFIIASCPGEPLPSFPEPTHCNPTELHLHPKRLPWVGVNPIINSIPQGTSLHDPVNPPHYLMPPYDGDKPLRRTITCGEGEGYHPSGRRKFTLREIACLQGFPLEHEFGARGIRKQIGNAVPPIVAKVFFEQIIRDLKKADGIDEP